MRVRPIRHIRVAGRSRERAESLASALQESLGIDVHPVDTYAEACADADVVCAATHSPDPVVHRDALKPGVHVTSVGFNTAGREVDSATVVDSLVVVESRAAVLAPPPAGSNGLTAPMQEGLIGEDTSRRDRRTPHGHENRPKLAGSDPLYKSVGIAAQDVAASNLVLSAARERKLGIQVELSQ